MSEKKIVVPQKKERKTTIERWSSFLCIEATKKIFFRSLIRFRTPTGYEINEKVENTLVNKLEFEFSGLLVAIIKIVICHTFYFHVENFFDKRGGGNFRR